ncbi:MAG: tRNA (adenosine(37)-N6)-dimethylallyltransferase MiaA [Microscillaceae bacterium]|nr:tRNA (adenosine(37)-N6)-dimethylallyltransferase MiaA [Microscillaceae bacterium]MDW8460635.1 tRNA (adenosine(37)-N6)-dimethylallyltransferase MiaA [Cytophagales bacterium]
MFQFSRSSKPLLLAIVGATASGKTAWAIRIAQKLQTEILSADSRQFFREMTIGTAKPTTQELAQVPHHFINSHSITQNYNAGQYEIEALACLEKLFQTYSVVVLVGGSGLYIKALCEGIDEMPAVLPEVRAELNQIYQTRGLSTLLQWLKEKDEVYYQQVDKANPQRVIRALEVCLSTQQPYSQFRKKHPKERFFEVQKIAINLPRKVLYDRINQRVESMIKQGLLDEVKSLLPYRNHNALQTVGYQEVFNYLDGKISWNECIETIKQNTRHYAKRQLTWFRKDTTIQWLTPDELEKWVQQH